MLVIKNVNSRVLDTSYKNSPFSLCHFSVNLKVFLQIRHLLRGGKPPQGMSTAEWRGKGEGITVRQNNINGSVITEKKNRIQISGTSLREGALFGQSDCCC